LGRDSVECICPHPENDKRVKSRSWLHFVFQITWEKSFNFIDKSKIQWFYSLINVLR
jgi:hypothetical protein